MAFDTGRARTVLFGGSEFNLLSDQTWEWDGSQWTRLFPTTSPAPRTRSAAAFDEQRGRVVLFGGITSGGYGADTWEWDGAQWTPRQPVHAPGGRYGHALAYDPARGRVVLFGGQNGPVLADTWEWDGSDWIRRTPNGAPPARSSHAMAYDSARAQLLVFGGLRQRTLDDAEFLDDTWRYTPDHPARFAAYGAGCAGSAGVPDLLPAAGSAPWLGDRFTLQVARLPAVTQVGLLLGASRASWNGTPLPLLLDPLGMPGCALRARPTLVLPGVLQAGVATIALDLPADPALAGQPFFTQALVLDPGANAAGAVLSPGGEATAGLR